MLGSWFHEAVGNVPHKQRLDKTGVSPRTTSQEGIKDGGKMIVSLSLSSLSCNSKSCAAWGRDMDDIDTDDAMLFRVALAFVMMNDENDDE